MAHLTSAAHEPERDATSSRAILLLDFLKAYDTVSREFLFEVMRAFGFYGAFITMARHLHTNTTARFLVNGILSDPVPVRTGIRQGCPLAPLLFLLTAEILAIALLQTPTVQGLRHPRFSVTSRNSLLLSMTQPSFFNAQINSPMSWKLSTGSVSCLDSGCNRRRVFSSCLIRRWTSPTTPEFQCFATAIRLDT